MDKRHRRSGNRIAKPKAPADLSRKAGFFLFLELFIRKLMRTFSVRENGRVPSGDSWCGHFLFGKADVCCPEICGADTFCLGERTRSVQRFVVRTLSVRKKRTFVVRGFVVRTLSVRENGRLLSENLCSGHFLSGKSGHIPSGDLWCGHLLPGEADVICPEIREADVCCPGIRALDTFCPEKMV